MNKPLQKEQPAQIQLELPDYSYAYEQWKKKSKNHLKAKKKAT